MRIFSEFLDKMADADDRTRHQSQPVRNAQLNDKDVITVDSEVIPQDTSGRRPPIIFENGYL